MRKILSLVIFAAALIWTWSLIHSSPSVGFETHSGIQEKLIALITETVRAKKAQARDFKITKLWTETLEDNKVRAVFSYRFVEPGEGAEVVEQSVDGEAILHREPSSDDTIDRWVVQSARTTGDSVNFVEGMIVTPVPEEGEGGSDAPAGSPPAAGEPAGG